MTRYTTESPSLNDYLAARDALQRGEPVSIVDGGLGIRIRAAEQVNCEADASLIIMARNRGQRLGLGNGHVARVLPAGKSQRRRIVDLALTAQAPKRAEELGSLPIYALANIRANLVDLAVQFLRQSWMMPVAFADFVYPTDAGDHIINAELIHSEDREGAASLQIVSEARLPIDETDDSRIVIFRGVDGSMLEKAIVIGRPDPSRPVLIRMHSECLTGDIFGSKRCDCGEQLHTALATMAEEGAGILLYLAQEGRNIGLVNKMRAYGLQDRGLDTVDANVHLGFESDARTWYRAARMLELLGVKSVRLLTNNPKKMHELADLDVEIVERVPLVVKANAHNAAYLQTKSVRAGHMFGPDADHRTEAVADTSPQSKVAE